MTDFRFFMEIFKKIVIFDENSSNVESSAKQNVELQSKSLESSSKSEFSSDEGMVLLFFSMLPK